MSSCKPCSLTTFIMAANNSAEISTVLNSDSTVVKGIFYEKYLDIIKLDKMRCLLLCTDRRRVDLS